MAVEFDVFYRPHSAGLEWARELSPETSLVLGTPTETIARALGVLGLQESRGASSRGHRSSLHDGTYAVWRRGAWHLIYVTNTQPAVEAAEDQVNYSTSHLAEAADARVLEWKDAQPLLEASPFHQGQLVRPLSYKGWGTVRSVERKTHGHDIAVEIGNRVEHFQEDDLVLVDGDPRDPLLWISHGAVEADRIALTLSWLKLDTPLNNTLYSYAATKTIFKPYQFIPVLKMLGNSKGRILIADEVGLGKTIEAGLIWTELDQRQRIRRALVVVPASLKVKWRKEMDNRFSRELKDLKADDLREFIQAIRDDKDPELLGVISLESFRTARDVLEGLVDVQAQFDLVIVDEAHALRNRNSKSYGVGQVLADMATDIVFLSATPLNLGTDDLFNLLTLLDTESFPDKGVFGEQLEPNDYLNRIARVVSVKADGALPAALALLEQIPTTVYGETLATRTDFQRLRDILSGQGEITPDMISRVRRITSELNTLGSVFTRTRKIDVPSDKAIRVVEQVEVEWSSDESRLYQAIYDYSMARALSKKMPLGFTMQMPLRQACSSLPVMQEKIAIRENWDLGVGDDDDVFDIEEEGRVHEDVDTSELLQIEILRTKITHDSKLDALRTRLLKARANGMKRAMIFSFFRGTVEYLARELSTDFSVGILHGGVPLIDRDGVIQSFRDGDFEILIANQVGSEGLDFQFCNVLVNYDLPWNPMQVEQRIGRLDRFGQENEKIFIFNMKTPGTIESDIFGRLYDRIGIFERSIGDLEPIMRQTFDALSHEILNPRLNDIQRAQKIDDFAVQSHNQAHNIAEIEKNRGNLAAASILEIEGLSEFGPAHGRYIGHAELLNLVTFVVEQFGGSLTVNERDRTLSIIGTLGLMTALNAVPTEHIRSQTLRTKLARACANGTAHVATWWANHPDVDKLDLISATHPLVILAVEYLRERRHEIVRYGAVKIADVPADEQYLVSLDLLRARGGLVDTNELWVTAVNTVTGIASEEIADKLLVALAEGRLETASALPTSEAGKVYAQIGHVLGDRLYLERLERAQENTALVRARIDSFRRSIEIKRNRDQAVVDGFIAEKRNLNMLPLWEARVRKHNQDMHEVGPRFEARNNLVISHEIVALVLVTGS